MSEHLAVVDVAPNVDPREIARVVAVVLLAGAAPTSEERARADALLASLGRPCLKASDLGVATPEQLAPCVPVHVRRGLAEGLLHLAERDALRRRQAYAFLRLWGLPTPVEEAPNRPGVLASVARWVVGPLPRHHQTGIPGEKVMAASIYRTNEMESTTAASAHDPLRRRVERIHAEFQRVVSEIARAFIGKREVIERVLVAMTARGHVLLVDNPGVGKTLLCKAIAASMGVHFGRVQFTPDLLPMDLTGGSIYEANERRFVFRRGPIFTNLLLADEINRATPKTQSALLEVMEERTVTVDGQTHRMAEPFQVLATMNPLDHEGTFALPAAQIDRFMVMLELGLPTPDDEVRVLDTHLAPDPALASVRPAISGEAFLEWQKTAPLVHASPEVKRAAVDYVQGLRKGADAGHAVSPRATLAWMKAAQARALLEGREFVTVEDLLEMAPHVLRHRLWVSPEEVRDRLKVASSRATEQAR